MEKSIKDYFNYRNMPFFVFFIIFATGAILMITFSLGHPTTRNLIISLVGATIMALAIVFLKSDKKILQSRMVYDWYYKKYVK